jgi:hypothetical protein
MAFMRYYGMEGDPRPKPVPKRKSAGAGPRVKAQRKRVVRSKRAARGQQGKKGADLGGLVTLAKSRGKDILEQLRAGNAPAALVQGLIGSGRKAAGGGGGGRRTINPANVKALRRALRRFDGFSNLVKRVNKFLPTGAKFTHHKPCSPSKRGKR